MYGIEKIGERFDLMRRMADTLDVSVMGAVADGRLGAMDLRTAVLNCTACDHSGACESWLAAHRDSGADAPPPFCRNEDLMLELARDR